jgi:vitamin B12/bleomycin/antimicrobial peptide transport system ATP-binding/permease protein
VLEEVGLGTFAGELDRIENWSQRLSLGEQQRFAFARILLVEPALLFLDEATRRLMSPQRRSSMPAARRVVATYRG